MKVAKIGINGFGRIGRLMLRATLGRKDVLVVAVNDPFIAPDYAKYLLTFDSVHGKLDADVEVVEGGLKVNGNFIKFTAELEPTKIDWKASGAEYIAEETRKFTISDKASLHLQEGAKKV